MLNFLGYVALVICLIAVMTLHPIPLCLDQSGGLTDE